MKVIADEMAECWWMFGEGKIDYGGFWESLKEKLPWQEGHCAICSVVKFDKKISNEISKISYEEFYNYLDQTNKDETQTYLKYLYLVNSLDGDSGFFKNFKIAEKDVVEGNLILTEDKFSIVTGRKRGGIIFPYFVKSDEIKKSECEVFDITKA